MFGKSSEKSTGYFIGFAAIIILLSMFVSTLLVSFSKIAPYIMAMGLLIAPFLGKRNLEKKKNAMRISTACRSLLKWNKYMKKGGYVVLGVSLVLSLPTMAYYFISKVSVIVCSLLFIVLVWEGLRFIQKRKKKKALPSFWSTIKACW